MRSRPLRLLTMMVIPFSLCSARLQVFIFITAALFSAQHAPLVLFSLEAFGFCPRGTAADVVAGGGTRPGGRLPVNTSGGSLSEVYLHGMNLVIEAIRQIRGTSSSQVAGAEYSLVTSCDATPNGAILLRRK